jgi:RecA-family ATPase
LPYAYLIEDLLPTHEVHLLAGPSGAGKTRWLFQMLLEWQQGLPVLGKKSYPCEWVYVSGDRSRDSVTRTLGGMGIDPDKVPLVPAWDDHMGINEIFDEIQKSGASFAIIEAFGSFVEPPGNGKCVKQFLQRCDRFMKLAECTILGIVESPKLKPYERYENPRQRVSGAAAWAHFSETIFLVEPDDLSVPDNPHRTLTVCPRNGPGMTFNMVFDSSGRLQPVRTLDRL